MPQHLVWRQPFPGPGLAIRVLCADEPYIKEDFDTMQANLVQACAELSDLPVKAVLLPVRTVGVQGDGRTYSYLAALSLPTDPKSSWPQLLALAKRIPGTVHKVNRVVFLMGAPVEVPPRDITPTRLTEEPLAQLRRADKIVNDALVKYGLVRSLAQVLCRRPCPRGHGLASSPPLARPSTLPPPATS